MKQPRTKSTSLINILWWALAIAFGIMLGLAIGHTSFGWNWPF